MTGRLAHMWGWLRLGRWVAAATGLAAGLAWATAGVAQTVTWTAQVDAATLDPHASGRASVRTLVHQLYEPLVALDEDLDPEPALATEWRRVADAPRRWRFTLDPEARFHDGSQLTAEDVVVSLRRAARPESAVSGLLAGIEELRALERHEVQITTTAPDPRLPRRLANAFIMNADWLAERDLAAPGAQPQLAAANGTGAYRLVTREPGARTVLARVDAEADSAPADSHDAESEADEAAESGEGATGMPAERLVFRPEPDAQRRLAMLRDGTVDIVLDPPVNRIAALRAEPGLKVAQAVENKTLFLGLDTARDSLAGDASDGNPLASKAVRTALAIALDSAAIRRHPLRGEAATADQLPPPMLAGRQEDAAAPARGSLDEARALLAEAGYPDGFALALACPEGAYRRDRAVCRAAAGLLARIDVAAEITLRDPEAHVAHVRAGEAEAYLLGWHAPTGDSWELLHFLFHSRSGETGAGVWNATGFADATLDRRIAELATEMDPEARRDGMQEAWQRANAARVYLPLHYQVVSWALRDGVSLPAHSNGVPRFVELRLTQDGDDADGSDG